MQANAIWEGADYAYADYATRGGPLNLYAKRCKIIRKYEQQKPGRTRNSTFCEIIRLTEDGELYNGGHRIEIEARKIIDLWDNYEAEREPILEKRRREEAEWQQKREQQHKEYEEKQAHYIAAQFIYSSWKRELRRREELKIEEERKALLARRARIHNVLVSRGLNPSKFSVPGDVVTINTEELERWLGLN